MQRIECYTHPLEPNSINEHSVQALSERIPVVCSCPASNEAYSFSADIRYLTVYMMRFTINGISAAVISNNLSKNNEF